VSRATGSPSGSGAHILLYERALSESDVGHTSDDMRETRGVGEPKTPHERE